MSIRSESVTSQIVTWEMKYYFGCACFKDDRALCRITETNQVLLATSCHWKDCIDSS